MQEIVKQRSLGVFSFRYNCSAVCNELCELSADDHHDNRSSSLSQPPPPSAFRQMF